MLRLRIVVPLLLSSSLASAPALGEFNVSHCIASPASPRCEAELARAFARARNAEINASMARVSQERARVFAAARNGEIDASIAKVLAVRAFEKARNAEIDASIAAVKREHARAFAAARNAEINASIATVNALRAREFAEARNAEINASMARANAARLALSTTHCKTPYSSTPRCEAERAHAFVAARNAEIDASIAKVAAVRSFERARSAEIDASLAAVKRERARQFAAARNAEINASIATVKQERAQQFAAARNAEINASILAARAQRALRLALAARRSGIETGAISLPDTVGMADRAPVVRRPRQARYLGPCREATHLMNPLQFTDGNAELEPAMKPELDRIAMMARNCPAIHIELHGYSDNSGPVQINRHLAQRRAQAAAEYLIHSGVEKSRLTTIGHAASKPVVPNSSDVNRAINRRVEVTIKDPAMLAAAQRVIWDLAAELDPAYMPPLAQLSP